MKTISRFSCAWAAIAAVSLTCSAFSAETGKSYDDRLQDVKTVLAAKRSGTKEAFFTELETQARALMKDFPDKSEPYEMLLGVAQNSDEQKTRTILKEIAGSKAPENVKAAAKGMGAKLDAVGKPVDIKFTALDGREVNVGSLGGKVVLVDFWATWCGPCVGEIPHVKEAYDKLHAKGFEIVGISFDQDKKALEDFVKEKGMAWPQYFDGKGWQNSFGQKYGINSIPAMWLVDKKGNLRDLNARGDLEAKVGKLLAE